MMEREKQITRIYPIAGEKNTPFIRVKLCEKRKYSHESNENDSFPKILSWIESMIEVDACQ